MLLLLLLLRFVLFVRVVAATSISASSTTAAAASVVPATYSSAITAKFFASFSTSASLSIACFTFTLLTAALSSFSVTLCPNHHTRLLPSPAFHAGPGDLGFGELRDSCATLYHTSVERRDVHVHL